MQIQSKFSTQSINPFQNFKGKFDQSYHHEKDLELMITAFQEHRIDEAYVHRENYLTKVKQSKAQLNPQFQGLISRIQQQMQELRVYEKQFEPQGWVLKQNNKNHKIYTKEYSGTVASLIQSDMQVPVENFMFILSDIDLMKNVMPFMVYSKEERQIDRNNKIGHIVCEIPVLSKREAHFQGIGYDRMDYNKTIFLYTKSLHDRKDLQQKLNYFINPDPKAVQLDFKFLMVEYTPYCTKTGKIRLALNIDIKLKLPKFIMDPVIQLFAKEFVKNLLHATTHFEGSQWEKRLIQKPEFANFVRACIKRHFL